MTALPDTRRRVCLGAIAGAHGVRGLVRIKPFTERPEDVAAYGPLTDEAGLRRFEIRVQGLHKGLVVAALAGVEDRDAALALRGVGLWVDRAALPEPTADEYYHADLIGLDVTATDGTRLGTVKAVHDFGAGDVIEVMLAETGRTVMLPFTAETVPEVAPAEGRLTVAPPPGLLDAEDAGGRERDGDAA